MDFQQLAANEATTLVGRLRAARADASLREWQAFRRALDEAAQGVEASITSDTTAEEEALVSALVEQLSGAAAEEVHGAVSRVSAEATAVQDSLRRDLAERINHGARLEASLNEALARADSLGLELDAEKRALAQRTDQVAKLEATLNETVIRADSLERDLDAEQRGRADQVAKLEASLGEAAGRVDSLGQELEGARNESDGLRSELAQSRERQAQAEGALRSAEGSWQRDTRAKEAAERELQTLREAFEVMRTNHASVSRQLDTDVAEARSANDTLRRDLDEQAALNAELEATSRQARAQADALTVDLQTERKALESVRAELARIREAQTAAESTLRGSEAAWQKDARAKESAERELQAQRAALDQLRSEFTRVSRQLESEVTERAALAAALRSAHGQADTAESERKALADRMAEATSRAEAATHLDADLKRWRTEAEESSRTVRQLKDDLERVTAEAETQRVEQINSLRDHVVGAVSGALDSLLVTYRRLAASQTIADVLTALVVGFANDFSRVALFTVKQDRLEGAQQVGFDQPDEIIDRVVPLSADSLLTEAVKSGRVQGRTGSALTEASSALFGGAPGFLLVVPIVIHGKVLAVIYADDSNRPPTDFVTPEQRVKLAQLLLSLAVSRMPRLLMELRVPEPSREPAVSRHA